jgi:hypothetical protein
MTSIEHEVSRVSSTGFSNDSERTSKLWFYHKKHLYISFLTKQPVKYDSTVSM